MWNKEANISYIVLNSTTVIFGVSLVFNPKQMISEVSLVL
jgi:hypothetical protein